VGMIHNADAVSAEAKIHMLGILILVMYLLQIQTMRLLEEKLIPGYILLQVRDH
jgi:hypothetical protein